MATPAALRLAPLQRSMAVLDPTAFTKRVQLVGLRIPAAKAAGAMKALDTHLLNCPRLRNLVEDPAESRKTSQRLLLLNAEYSDPSQIPRDDLSAILEPMEIPVEPVSYSLELDYNFWTVEDILRAILPNDREIITAFESIGDVAHMNLRDHLLPYKSIIGRVIVDKNKHINTVVNKTSNIHTQFRTFPLEIVANREGARPDHTPQQLETKVSENGVDFQLDFAQVYWNSRLHTEHSRIISSFEPHALVADAMCGIGPFALPAAKMRGACVFANDLNPESHKWLVHNLRVNHLGFHGDDEKIMLSKRPLGSGTVFPSNRDARDFIRTSIADLNNAYETRVKPAYVAAAAEERSRAAAKEKKRKNASAHRSAANAHEAAIARWDAVPVRVFQHYVMNLPASALAFLDGFHGLLRDHVSLKESLQLPRVHVYCFTRAIDDPAADVRARVERVLGASTPDITVHRVRLVAPRKLMCCAEFTLPTAVAYGEVQPGDINPELHYDHEESEDNGACESNAEGSDPQSSSEKNVNAKASDESFTDQPQSPSSPPSKRLKLE